LNSIVIATCFAVYLLVLISATQISSHAVPATKAKSDKAAQGGAGAEDKLIKAAKDLFAVYKTAYIKYDYDGYDKFYSNKLRAFVIVCGQTKEMDGKAWRALSLKGRQQMRAKGIGSQFSAAQYSAKGNYVRVRFNVKASVELDTIDWLLEKGPDGTLKIIEERQTVSVVKP